MQLKNLGLFCLSCFFAASLSAQTATETFAPTIKVKALVHSRYEASLTDSVDVQNKFSSDPLNSNFRLRRIELRADVNLDERFSGVIRVQLPELKGSSPGKTIELAYMEYKYNDKLKFRAGQFKMPYELDEQTSHEDLRMIDRGPTSSMFVSSNLASYQPGAMLFGTFMKDKHPLNYYLAVSNGSNRCTTYDNDSQKNLVGRLEYSIVKEMKLGVNAQNVYVKDTSALSYGADLSIIHKFNDKYKLIVEGEYIQGMNTNTFLADTFGLSIDKFNMGGYFAQALLKVEINKSWCKTLEFGGKYENTDPNTTVDNNAFSTITGNVGFTFLPNNDARLQLNVIHTDWESSISKGNIVASNLFVAQFQLKI